MLGSRELGDRAGHRALSGQQQFCKFLPNDFRAGPPQSAPSERAGRETEASGL